MPPAAEPLMPADVFASVVPLLRRTPSEEPAGPRCVWCQSPTVWTTGNKTRCPVCGYVPS